MKPPHPIADPPICVALDFDDPDRVVRLASELRDEVGMVKVGATSFVEAGPRLIESVRPQQIFLDLKFHDIPVQVAGAIRACARAGVTVTTVHASGGRPMLEAAAEAAGAELTVAAVTVLTSLDSGDLGELGISGSTPDAVTRLAELALGAGIGALVCSPLEVEILRSRFGPSSSGGPYLIVPGIRPFEGDDDQRRTLTPKEAMAAGADLLVIGRPITGASDPVAAARAITREL